MLSSALSPPTRTRCLSLLTRRCTVHLLALPLRKLPKKLVVADFGCGEGRLAKSVPHKVHSFDLVAAHDHIVACDIANVSTASPEVPPPTIMLTISPLSGASEGQ